MLVVLLPYLPSLFLIAACWTVIHSNCLWNCGKRLWRIINGRFWSEYRRCCFYCRSIRIFLYRTNTFTFMCPFLIVDDNRCETWRTLCRNPTRTRSALRSTLESSPSTPSPSTRSTANSPAKRWRCCDSPWLWERWSLQCFSCSFEPFFVIN